MTTKQKSLSERLAEFKGYKPKGMLVSMLDEIEQTLSDGWTKKDIHELLVSEGKVNTGYPNFLRQLSKLLESREKLQPANVSLPPAVLNKTPRRSAIANDDNKPKIFNPVPRDASELF